MSYEAKVLADSMSPDGVRLTTIQVTMPRIVLAEFNTHRVLSRNSASSRAIPVEKRIAMIEADPFIPEAFGKNQKGMQAAELLDAAQRSAAEAARGGDEEVGLGLAAAAGVRESHEDVHGGLPMKVATVKCDRCGKIENPQGVIEELPIFWRRLIRRDNDTDTRAKTPTTTDLCANCSNSFDNWMKMNKAEE